MSAVEPMSKKLFDELIAAGATEIRLAFSGGNDLDVLIEYKDSSTVSDKVSKNLEKKVEDWAWDLYGYSGDYGKDYRLQIFRRGVCRKSLIIIQKMEVK